MEVKEINEASQALAVQLKSFPRITTKDDYVKAGQLWKTGKDMLRSIDMAYDSIIAAAYKAHREAVAKKAFYARPIEEGVKTIKRLMEEYDREQERKRLEEQRRLEAEARKAEEERILQEAVELEKMGNKKEAEELIETAQIETPAVIVPKETPKLDDGPKFRTVWKAQVVDFSLLVKAVAEGKVPEKALMPNDTFLRQQAQSLKETANIPGVRVYSERV